MTAPITRQVKTLDLDLGGRSKLRICLVHDGKGEPESLLLSRGFGDGPAFYRPGWEPLPLHLPPSAIPDVIEALRALEEKEP
jgi:hypothetical protein